MLQFNPYNRPTAKELLQHKMFDHIRNEDLEQPASYKVVIDIDNEKHEPNGKSNKDNFIENILIILTQSSNN